MKTLFLGTMLLVLMFVVPMPTMAGVAVGVGVALPPPIVVETPPAVVALPAAPGVYAAPDVDVDLFFWNGWWWRPWGGHWYRSRYYDHGWGYFRNVPRFYSRVNPGGEDITEGIIGTVARGTIIGFLIKNLCVGITGITGVN